MNRKYLLQQLSTAELKTVASAANFNVTLIARRYDLTRQVVSCLLARRFGKEQVREWRSHRKTQLKSKTKAKMASKNNY